MKTQNTSCLTKKCYRDQGHYGSIKSGGGQDCQKGSLEQISPLGSDFFGVSFLGNFTLVVSLG